ncbi:MAG TPA: hypothetical protein VGS19_07340 [Streptosporangiaceae bacterium]|nr:hypothetical protein [Streptosporangiaceae bacterium]
MPRPHGEAAGPVTAEGFIGRTDELHNALDLLLAPNDGAVMDVVGVHGIGKSAFLERLREAALSIRSDPSDPSVYVAEPIDMEPRYDLGEEFSGDWGKHASSEVVVKVFELSGDIMRRLGAKQDRLDEFRIKARSLDNVSNDYLSSNDISLSPQSQDGPAAHLDQPGNAAVRQHYREWQAQLDEAFLAVWTQSTLRLRALITVDTFQVAADNELGRWLIRLASRMPNTLLVIARTPGEEESVRPFGVRPTYLDGFSKDEMRAYLAHCVPAGEVSPEVADVAYEFTGGHPGGVSLVATELSRLGDKALDAAEFRRVLTTLPAMGDQRWGQLVWHILDSIHAPALRQAVEAASVTSTFDSDLLAALVAADGAPGADMDHVISELAEMKIFRKVPTHDDEAPRYRLADFIRVSEAEQLRMSDWQRWRRFQAAAAKHYYELLQEWEDEPYESYGAWLRFEDPRWQEQKREWLRHSRLAGADRAVIRAQFAVVFLDMFWWWGYYVPFPDMRRLLEDWARSIAQQRGKTPKDPDEVLLEDLTTIISDYPVCHVVGYPIGYIKPSNAPWDKLREAFLRVRALCGFEQSTLRHVPAGDEAVMKRVDALVDLFVAQTRRFRDPHDPQAETFYQAAAGAFERLGDAWTCSWIHFERADMALERGDLAACRAWVAEGAKATRALAGKDEDSPEWDYELIANLHRVWADVLWQEGRLAAAATEYGRAVAAAYRFQGQPRPPDRYTERFYAEMTDRAAARIAELAERQADMADFVAGVCRMVPGSGPADPLENLANIEVEVVRDKVFAPGPAVDELRLDIASPFMTRFNVLRVEFEDPLTGLDILAGAAQDAAS